MEDCEDTIKGCEGPEGAWRTVRVVRTMGNMLMTIRAIP